MMSLGTHKIPISLGKTTALICELLALWQTTESANWVRF